MKKKWIVLALLVVLAGGGFALWRSAGHRHGDSLSKKAARYYCPMHPTYTSDRPGDCPICNMKLVLMEETGTGETESAPAAATSGKSVCLLHNCTMTNCPMELELKPGQEVSCPVCGTHVAGAGESPRGRILYYRHPMRPEVTSPVPNKDEMGMDYVPVYAEETADASAVAGRATVSLPAQGRQLIGMKSDVIAKRTLRSTVRASGRVAYDPDLYNAIVEYSEAVKAKDKVKESPWPDIRERTTALVRASELRLRQMGLSSSQIAGYAAKGADMPTNLLLGEVGGTVWVYAQVYEYEIGLVEPGQKVEITTPAYPGRKFYGSVRALNPILSAESRSLRIRIEVPNPEGHLKLEMYVNAAIVVDMGERLAIPEEAVLEAGDRQIVFIDLTGGRIEPREVQLGQEAGGYFEVLSGVREGERVVTTANFLIDSESRLKAAARMPSSSPSAQPRMAEPPAGTAIGKSKEKSGSAPQAPAGSAPPAPQVPASPTPAHQH